MFCLNTANERLAMWSHWSHPLWLNGVRRYKRTNHDDLYYLKLTNHLHTEYDHLYQPTAVSSSMRSISINMSVIYTSENVLLVLFTYGTQRHLKRNHTLWHQNTTAQSICYRRAREIKAISFINVSGNVISF